MTTQEYLSQIKRLDQMIENKLAEIEKLSTMATKITVKPKEVSVQTSPKQDKLGDAVAKIADIKSEVAEIVDSLIDTKKHIISQLDNMSNDDMSNILTKRFVLGKNFNEISYEISYSYKHTKRIYYRAMEEFERLYGDEYLNMSYNDLKCPKMSY